MLLKLPMSLYESILKATDLSDRKETNSLESKHSKMSFL